MILYHTVSTYQLLCALVHKTVIYRDEEAVLIAASTLKDKYPDIDKDESKIFSKVCIYNSFWEAENDSIGDKYIKYLESFLKKEQIDIYNAEEIFVGGMHLLFGVYTAIKGIPINYFEDASGLLSRDYVLLENESFHPDRKAVCEKNGIYDGTADNVKTIICNLNAQEKGFKRSNKIVDFNVTQELYNLKRPLRDAIKSYFVDFDTIHINQDSVLFLSQHFCNLGLMTFEENIDITKLVFDYFFEDKNLIIKPHPDDVIYYKKLFPKAIVIREVFPSEFLPIIFDNNPTQIATISSTAINNLTGFYENFFTFDYEFQQHFYDIYKYAFVVELLYRIGVEDVTTCGVDKALFDNLKRHLAVEHTAAAEANVTVVDDFMEWENDRHRLLIDMENATNMDVWIFLNNLDKYVFYDYSYKHLWKNIIPICITHEKGEKSTEKYSETLYVYLTSESLKKSIKEVTYMKKLKYMNEKISVKELNEYEREIKRLEGILKATENRLLTYIEKEKNIDSNACVRGK